MPIEEKAAGGAESKDGRPSQRGVSAGEVFRQAAALHREGRLPEAAGAVMYFPVAVPGALFSVGDPHASQGDSELCGTAIECSLTGTFQLVLHKRDRLAGTALADLHYPLLETQDEWVVHGFGKCPVGDVALGVAAADLP